MGVKPGYKQTELGVIPENWEVRQLSSVVTVANGQVDPKVEPYRSMVLVAPDHIESGTGKLIEKRTAEDQHAISGKYLFKAGDIVYSKIRPYLRKAILADFAGLCSADMYPLTPADDIVAGFVFPLLLGQRFSKYAESVSIRSGMPKINRQELADFSVAMPHEPEQRAIAKALGDVDALLDGLDRLIAKKRDLKQAAMQQLLTAQTRLPGFTGAWAGTTLGKLGVTYGGLSGKTKADFGLGSAYYITFLNIMNNVVINTNQFEHVRIRLHESQNAVEKGDLFFNGSSETPEEVGMCAILLAKVSGVYLNSFCFGFRLRNKESVNGLYLAYFFRSGEGRKLLYSLAQGATRHNLSKTSLLALDFLLPSYSEQTAIAEVLSDMDAELAALVSRRDKTRALKQGMMQELLTGKTRLN